MALKQLDGIKMGETWTSYMAAVYGSLKGAGLWHDEIYRLMGMSGIGFHFIIHEQASVTSATVYDWQSGHLAALDRIGIHSQSEFYWNNPGMNTFERTRTIAVEQIKNSIDRGKSVIIWAPTDILEFGIIDGYDDQDGIFSVKSCSDPYSDPLLYENLGRSEVPILYYQIIKGAVEVDSEKVYRNSLTFGLSEWRKDYHSDPHFASGSRAYDNLLKTLKNGDYQEFGLTYLMAVYADAKACIAKYLDSIVKDSKKLSDISEAAKHYHDSARLFAEIAEKVPFLGPESKKTRSGIINRRVIPDVIKLVHDSKISESKAMTIIEENLF